MGGFRWLAIRAWSWKDLLMKADQVHDTINDAMSACEGFVDASTESENAKLAADWMLAAKNAASVVLTLSQAEKTAAGAPRR